MSFIVKSRIKHGKETLYREEKRGKWFKDKKPLPPAKNLTKNCTKTYVLPCFFLI